MPLNFLVFTHINSKIICFQVMIQTPRNEGGNILTREGLLEHVTIMEQIAQYKVEVSGE